MPMAAVTALALSTSLLPQFLHAKATTRSRIPFHSLSSPSILPSTALLHQRRRLRLRRRSSELVACLPSDSSPSSPDPQVAVALPSTKLYVSGLSFRTTEEGLRNAFQQFGQLTEVNLVMDRVVNRSRGFAFLRYATVEESQRAIEGMHGKFLDGRVIFVEAAKPRSQLRQSPKQLPNRY